MKLDVHIAGATVFDGVREEARRLDVGFRGEQIAYVGEPLHGPAAECRIDGRGLFLTPGFIDTHASTGLGYRLPNAADHKLFQGVTTEITGNCGTSTAPVGPLLETTMERLAGEIGFTFDWRGFGEWLSLVEEHGLQFNVGSLVGHATLRAGVVRDARQVSAEEIGEMAALLDQAAAEGGLGLSTGLVYAPGSFASTEELIELARIVARHGGIYASHIRDEREDLEKSIDEAIRIGHEAALPILVSHLKAAERPNWGKIPGILERLEAARAAGCEINFEVYPYAAVSTKLRTFIPKVMMAGGVRGMVKRLRSEDGRRHTVDHLLSRGTDFSAMRLITESLPGSRGASIEEVASTRGLPAAEIAVDLLLADPDAWIVYHCISEQDLDAAVLWPDSIVCSDSWSHPVNAPHQFGDPHPRTYGAFTRFLERWALTGRLAFGHAVRKITSLPARWLGLERRGCIAEGFYADLVLLDPSRLRERATYQQPRQMSEGTVRVWVNGTPVLEDGEILPVMPGRALRRSDA